jgi:hypothetical protein
MLRLSFGAALVGSLLVVATPTRADEFDDDNSPVNQNRNSDRDESWYYQPSAETTTTYQPNPLAIIHQKALARSQQRQDRLAAMHWYGMSNSRPTAQPTPFCSLYSPTWQAPGGKPFVWFVSGPPTYIVR